MIKTKPFIDDVYKTYPRTMEEAFGCAENDNGLCNALSADIAMFALAGVLVSIAAILWSM